MQNFLKKTYLWLVFSLIITSITCDILSGELFLEYFTSNGSYNWNYWLLFILLFVLTFVQEYLSKQPEIIQGFVLGLFSVCYGIILTPIGMIYSSESILITLSVTIIMFISLSVYSWITKRDVSGWGGFLFLALIGMVLACIINMFLKSTFLYYIISMIGVVVYSGLIIYETNGIKRGIYSSPVSAALNIYITFVGLFLNLLRLLGGKD